MSPCPVTYSRKHVMSHPLRVSPSLMSNNLTSNKSLLAYARAEAVIVSNHGDNKLTSLPFSDKVQVKGVKYMDFGWICVLAVTMVDGFQLWSRDGSRMLFFHPVRPANDSGSCFVRGVGIVKGRNEFLVGDSSGAMHTFLMAQASSGRGLNVKNTKGIREHGSAISDISCSEEYCVSADDRGSFCVFDINSAEPSGGHNLMSKRLFINAEVGFPCTSIAVHGEVFVAAFSSGHLRYYDLSTGDLCVEVAAHSRCITAVALNADASIISTVSEDCVLSVWTLPESPADGDQVELIFTDHVEDRQLTGVTFLVDGHGERKMVASSYDTDTLDVWNEVPSFR